MNRDHTARRRLSDILAGDTDTIRQQWDTTEAAADFAPLPGGTYEAHVQAVELFNAKTGTAGVQIQLRVAEGEHAGRCVFHDLWLTPAALPQTKRDCCKLGLDSLDKLESATVQPGRIRCRVRVALRTDDDGEQYNRVRRFDVLGIDEPERDPFAPDAETEGQAEDSPADLEGGEADGDASFDPEAIEAEAAAAAADTGAPTEPVEGGE
ncbi:MAG: DUF669 domain-containing protein [Phycisphaerae bacterium]|nr:DUF669 domain-containing protein [Phycisphaerae bacterium]